MPIYTCIYTYMMSGEVSIVVVVVVVVIYMIVRFIASLGRATLF